MMLQEEPDAAKLRKKVIDQQVQVASMRRVMKEIAKERDQYQIQVKAYRQPKHQEAWRLLTRKTYGDIIKALHPDRTKHVTAAELATAGRLITALRPLFDEN
jgi:chromosome segregation and condensation protein ScpB